MYLGFTFLMSLVVIFFYMVAETIRFGAIVLSFLPQLTLWENFGLYSLLFSL
jgi:hypothetical protein